MSLKETYSLAHTAQCKLRLSVERPDRNLRFMVGHAMHLDSLMLRIVEIEDSIQKSEHSSQVKFKGAGVKSGSHLSNRSSAARRSPPLRSAEEADDSDDDDKADEDGQDDPGEDLSLTRFPSGSAAPPRYPEEAPQSSSSEGDDSSSDEEYNNLLGRDPESLRELISNNSDGDEFLADLYNDIKGCPCHKSEAPDINRMWELPSEKGAPRMAVAEITV